MATGSSDDGRLKRVRLWDPGLRLFHWALASCVVAAWYLGEFGPGIMTLHFYAGYAVIALLAFRLAWGVFGPWPARFRDFLYSPRRLFAYVRGVGERRPSHWPGHNPMGALSVFALLGVVGFQAYTGLYSNPDDYINYGPLYDPENEGFSKWATGWHQALAPGLLLLVVLHLASIAYYKLWKHEDLVGPMISGRKVVAGDVPEGRIIETLPAAEAPDAEDSRAA